MNKRKWWALLLALILVVGVIPIQSVFAATTATLGIKADKKVANPGDTINFTVEIEQTGGISGWEFLVELPDGLSLVDSSLQAGELENLSTYLDKQKDGSIKGSANMNTGICGEGETTTHTLASFSATVDDDAEFQNYTLELKEGCFVADHTGTGYAAITTYACSVAVGPTIVVSDVKAGPGENAYVTIGLTDHPGIASMLLDVSFDADVLTLVDVNDAGVLGDTSHKPEYVTPYTLSWDNDTATDDFTATGTIVTLVFKVADDVEIGDVTPIEISYDYDQYDIMNADSQKVKFAIANGSVTIAQTGPNAIGDFEYTTSGTEMTITGYTGASKEVEIGSTYTVGDVEYTVTAIADDAFYDNSSIISVIIPETVTTIGAGAFYDCLSLTEVTVLSENATIGEVALGYYRISGTKSGIVEGFTIKGYEGSTAEAYAAAVEDITFVALPKPCKHSGGEATCKDLAVCENCGESYGELDPSNHKGDTYVEGQKETSCYEEGYTGDTYCSDCDVKIADGESIPVSSHNPASVWSTDATHHWKDCQTVGCGNLIEKAEHAGGEATCTKQAICSVCQVPYGSLDANKHKNTEIRDAVKETCNESGYTGDTWCKDCETKIEDGTTINPTGDHVDADDKWESSGAQHFHTCECGTEFDHEDHTGGKATCKEQAVCSVCEAAHGELNASNHKGETYLVGQKEASCYEEGYTGDTYCSDCDVKIADGEVIPTSSHNPASVWTTDATHHWKDCQTVGCGNLIEKAEHEGGEATCTKQAICSVCQVPYGSLDANKHKNTEIRDAVKETCNESGYTGDTWCKDCETKIEDGTTIDPTGDHVDADNKWESNGTQHFHTCGCGTEFDYANHAGGEATCKNKAVCSVCQASYGETNPSNHKGDTYLVGDKKATCKEEGYTGDTYCSDCDTKLSDGKTIDKVPHIVNEWTVSKEATVDEDGKKSGTCVECKDVLTVTTAKLVPEIKSENIEGIKAEVEAVGDTNISEDVFFVAEEVQNVLDATEKKDIENAIKTSISSEQNFKFAAIFDLKLMLRESDQNGEPIAETELELKGTVKVTIPVPTDVLEKLIDVKLVHIKDNGEAELIPFSLANGKATFEAKEFSYYTFIGTEKVSTNDSAAGNNSTNSPQTGDAVNMFIWIALLFISGTCFTVFVVSKKRTKQNR